MSTCEAEYVALSEGYMEVMGVYKVLEFLLEKCFFPITVWCNNKTAVDCILLTQPVKLKHWLIKNIDYVKETKRVKRVKVKWIRTDKQLADIMTKALPQKAYEKLREARRC